MGDDIVHYEILGSEMQLVEVELDPNEAVQAQVGAMCYMDQDIQMSTAASGGIFNSIKRMFSGSSFFIPTFTNKGSSKQIVSFSAPYPGKIIPIRLADYGGELLCQRDSFLCATNGIQMDIAFVKKLKAGFFGGEGFILQKLQGDGLAFIHGGGMIVKKELKEGQGLHVDTGSIVAFSKGVQYNVRFVGGVKNVLFSGEGLFFSDLQGPGTVFLQSMPFERLATRILSAKMGEKKFIQKPSKKVFIKQEHHQHYHS